MKKTYKIKDEWGQDVIYVEQCDKYEYEKQPDMPYLNKKESRHKTNEFENYRINGIIEKVRTIIKEDSGK